MCPSDLSDPTTHPPAPELGKRRYTATMLASGHKRVADVSPSPSCSSSWCDCVSPCSEKHDDCCLMVSLVQNQGKRHNAWADQCVKCSALSRCNAPLLVLVCLVAFLFGYDKKHAEIRDWEKNTKSNIYGPRQPECRTVRRVSLRLLVVCPSSGPSQLGRTGPPRNTTWLSNNLIQEEKSELRDVREGYILLQKRAIVQRQGRPGMSRPN